MHSAVADELMARYENRQELANKIDYEGGLLGFIFGYGIKLDDLPEDDQELRDAVAEVLKAKPSIERLEALLPEPGDEDED